ncbi:MAG: hypothetical protein ACJ71P_02405 [Nitrososphaeraceae archaeon]|jgi:hypothetical protein
MVNGSVFKQRHFKRRNHALREENRLIFSKMLSECKEEYYIKAATSKDEFFSAESLFIVLILQQQIEFSGHSKMQDLRRS